MSVSRAELRAFKYHHKWSEKGEWDVRVFECCRHCVTLEALCNTGLSRWRGSWVFGLSLKARGEEVRHLQGAWIWRLVLGGDAGQTQNLSEGLHVTTDGWVDGLYRYYRLCRSRMDVILSALRDRQLDSETQSWERDKKQLLNVFFERSIIQEDSVRCSHVSLPHHFCPCFLKKVSSLSALASVTFRKTTKIK